MTRLVPAGLALAIVLMPAPQGQDVTRVHERTVFFLEDASPAGGGSVQDSRAALTSTWHFETAERADETEERRTLVTSARGGSWSLLHADTVAMPGTRAPWRILPRRPLRLVVGPEDRIERFRLDRDEGPWELFPAPVTREWSSPDGTTLRVMDGELGTGEEDDLTGTVVDVSRSWRPGPEWEGAGVALDWVVLLADGEPVLFLEELIPNGPDAPRPGSYRGWSALVTPESLWPRVQVDWTERGAFERARQDIPARWTARAAGDDGFEAEWHNIGSWLEAGEGDGPLLPVRAFFQVEGEVRFDSDTLQVQGLVRHVRP